IEKVDVKTWSTILNFHKTTELFADEHFDGDPVMVYIPAPGESAVPPNQQTGNNENDDNIDPITGNPTLPGTVQGEENPGYTGGAYDDNASDDNNGDDDGGNGPRIKFLVNNVQFSIAGRRVQYLDASGKLITEELTDYT